MKKKAVFLDRDGVVNKEIGDYTYKEEDFCLTDTIIPALQQLTSKGYMLIIISNQGGIGKGLYSHAEVEKIHDKISSALWKNNIHITEFYYCPHHESSGKCLCRKPNSLMIEKAIARFGIDKNQAWFIGDSQRDVDAAHKAGIKAIQIKPNESLLEHIKKLD